MFSLTMESQKMYYIVFIERESLACLLHVDMNTESCPTVAF